MQLRCFSWQPKHPAWVAIELLLLPTGRLVMKVREMSVYDSKLKPRKRWQWWTCSRNNWWRRWRSEIPFTIFMLREKCVRGSSSGCWIRKKVKEGDKKKTRDKTRQTSSSVEQIMLDMTNEGLRWSKVKGQRDIDDIDDRYDVIWGEGVWGEELNLDVSQSYLFSFTHLFACVLSFFMQFFHSLSSSSLSSCNISLIDCRLPLCCHTCISHRRGTESVMQYFLLWESGRQINGKKKSKTVFLYHFSSSLPSVSWVSRWKDDADNTRNWCIDRDTFDSWVPLMKTKRWMKDSLEWSSFSSFFPSSLSFFLSFFIFLIFSDIEKMMPWLILQFYVSSSSHLLLKWQPIPTEFVVRCLLNIERHLFESFPIRYHSTSQACICKSSFLCSLLILSSFFPWSPFLSRNQETHQCSLDNSENCWLK